MKSGKCPKCDKTISRVKVEAIEIESSTSSFMGASYVCPSCHCVLGVEIDPIALKADILKKLGKG
jgi:hypothetical protein